MGRCVLFVVVIWLEPCALFAEFTAEPAPAFTLPGIAEPETDWTWQAVPDGLLYRSYAAGPKEPRFSTAFPYDTRADRWLFDATVGARVGIVRYGTTGIRQWIGATGNLEAPSVNGQVNSSQSFEPLERSP